MFTRISTHLLLANLKRVSQHLVGCGLAGEGSSNDHETVPDQHHFVDLLDLFQKHGDALNVRGGAALIRGRVQVYVIGFRKLHVRKQIRGDALRGTTI